MLNFPTRKGGVDLSVVQGNVLQAVWSKGNEYVSKGSMSVWRCARHCICVNII